LFEDSPRLVDASVNALGRAANGRGGVNANRNAGPGRRYLIETDPRFVNYDNFISSDQWLAGLGCEATGIDQWLYPAKRRRKLYPTLRVGREALARSWPMEPVCKWLQRLRELPEHVLDQMGCLS
jgi:hypothetical protein